MKTFILTLLSLTSLPATIYAGISEKNLTQCINLPIQYNKLNIPTTHLLINGKSIEFVIDLGKKQALTLDKELAESLTSDTYNIHTVAQTDLTGEQSNVQTGTIPTVILNGMLFQNINFDLYSPWGLWMNTRAEDNNLPNNTIGRDLFMNEKGILYYSRKNKNLHWCKAEKPDFEQHSKNIIWMPLEEDQEGIHITTEHKDKVLNFVLDSAATVSLIKPYTWVNFKDNDLYPDTKDLVYIDDLNIKNNPITTLAYKYSFPENFTSDGLMGDSFFQQTDLIIDTVNNKVGLVFLQTEQ
tara:strand:- start:13763 stop:14653 length:891 start_codon:yes stop_codon:yes gene_type:complete